MPHEAVAGTVGLMAELPEAKGLLRLLAGEGPVGKVLTPALGRGEDVRRLAAGEVHGHGDGLGLGEIGTERGKYLGDLIDGPDGPGHGLELGHGREEGEKGVGVVTYRIFSFWFLIHGHGSMVQTKLD